MFRLSVYPDIRNALKGAKERAKNRILKEIAKRVDLEPETPATPESKVPTFPEESYYLDNMIFIVHKDHLGKDREFWEDLAENLGLVVYFGREKMDERHKSGCVIGENSVQFQEHPEYVHHRQCVRQIFEAMRKWSTGTASVNIFWRATVCWTAEVSKNYPEPYIVGSLINRFDSPF